MMFHVNHVRDAEDRSMKEILLIGYLGLALLLSLLITTIIVLPFYIVILITATLYSIFEHIAKLITRVYHGLF